MVASALPASELYEPKTLRARSADVGADGCLLRHVRVAPPAGAGDELPLVVAVADRGSDRRWHHHRPFSVVAANRVQPPRLLDPDAQSHHRRRSLDLGAG